MSKDNGNRLSMLLRDKDRDFIKRAQALTDLDDVSSLIRRALETYIKEIEIVAEGGKVLLKRSGESETSQVEFLEVKKKQVSVS